MKPNKHRIWGEVLIVILVSLGCRLLTSNPTKPAEMRTPVETPEGATSSVISTIENLAGTQTPIETSVGTTPPAISTPEKEMSGFTLLGQIGGSAYAIAVEGNIVYMGQGPRLITLDVAQPSAPRLLGISQVLPGVVLGVQVAGGYAYVTTQYSGLHILDVRDPTRPTVVNSIPSKGVSCNDVALRNNLAYLACNTGGLYIVDVGNPQQPREVSRGKVPGNMISIALLGNFAYLVDITQRSLIAVDVSDPENPVKVSFVSPDNIPDKLIPSISFWSVRACSNYLCIAAFNYGLVVLDISNPAQPTFAGGYKAAGSFGLASKEDIVYLVDTLDGVYVLGLAASGQPSRVGLLPTSLGEFEFSGMEIAQRGVTAQGNLVFVTDPTYGLTLVDVSNPASPARVGHYQTPLPDVLIKVQVAGNYAYVAGRNSGFRVVDVSDPNAPREVYFDDSRKNDYTQSPTGLVIEGKYAYISDANYPFHIYDVSNPQKPIELGAVFDSHEPDGAFDIVLYGNVAYLSGSGSKHAFYPGEGLWVIDVSNPSQPKAAGFIDLPNERWKLAIYNHYLYAMDGGTDEKQSEPIALRVFDLSDPFRPVEVTHIPIPEGNGGSLVDMLVDDGHLFLSFTPSIIKIFDLNNPSQPVEVATHSLMIPGVPKIEKEGNILLVGSLVAYDISDLKNPILTGAALVPGTLVSVSLGFDIDMVGNTVFVATAFQGLYIYGYTPGTAVLPSQALPATVSLPTPVSNITPSPETEVSENLPPEGCVENLGKIVFSYDPQDMTSVHYGIYLMDSDCRNRVRLSSPEAKNDKQPVWSPERCRIAFVRFSGTGKGEDDIYVMSADGKTIRRLTTDPGRDTFPDWSPDGKQLSFISDRDGSRDLFVIDANGENQRQLTNQQLLPRTSKGYVQWQQWSPDGQEIAFTYNPGADQGTSIYIIQPDGSGLRQLVDRAAEPAWSPDGQKIYFFSNHTGQVEIWVINRDGTGLKQVSNVYGVVFGHHSLRVSPDGKQLAFYGTGTEVGELGSEIYVINVDGFGLNNISRAKGQDEWLDW